MATTTYTTNSIIWDSWSNSTAAASSYITTSSSVWNNWSATAASATTYTVNTKVWNNWAANTSVTATSDYSINLTWDSWNKTIVRARPVVQVVESEEDKAARLIRQEVLRAQREEQDRQRAMAIKRADRLLESVLSSAQKSQLKDKDYFLLKSQSGKIYRIRKGRSTNVDLLDENGKVVDILCAYPGLNVPDGDTMAAQKIMLECDEADFLKIAIRHRTRGEMVPLEQIAAILN